MAIQVVRDISEHVVHVFFDFETGALRAFWVGSMGDGGGDKGGTEANSVPSQVRTQSL